MFFFYVSCSYLGKTVVRCYIISNISLRFGFCIKLKKTRSQLISWTPLYVKCHDDIYQIIAAAPNRSWRCLIPICLLNIAHCDREDDSGWLVTLTTIHYGNWPNWLKKANKTIFVFSKSIFPKEQKRLVAIVYLKRIVVCTPYVKPKSGASHTHVSIIQRGGGWGWGVTGIHSKEVASSSSPVAWEAGESLLLKPPFLNYLIIYIYVQRKQLNIRTPLLFRDPSRCLDFYQNTLAGPLSW